MTECNRTLIGARGATLLPSAKPRSPFQLSRQEIGVASNSYRSDLNEMWRNVILDRRNEDWMLPVINIASFVDCDIAQLHAEVP